MAPRNRKARARTPLVWDVTEYLDRTHSPEDLGAALAGIAESRDAVLPQCADAAAAEMIGLEAHLRSMVTAFSMAVELTPKQTGDAILTALGNTLGVVVASSNLSPRDRRASIQIAVSRALEIIEAEEARTE